MNLLPCEMIHYIHSNKSRFKLLNSLFFLSLDIDARLSPPRGIPWENGERRERASPRALAFSLSLSTVSRLHALSISLSPVFPLPHIPRSLCGRERMHDAQIGRREAPISSRASAHRASLKLFTLVWTCSRAAFRAKIRTVLQSPLCSNETKPTTTFNKVLYCICICIVLYCVVFIHVK